jgi:predicted enzyme related to lactoylglutathione lyase
MDTVRFVSAIIFQSNDPGRLAAFYRDALGMPLESSDHDGDAQPHYECELGDLHFAIHPVETPPNEQSARRSRLKIAFAVFSLEAAIARLRRLGVELLYAPIDRGFAIMTAIEDPDGTTIELTQLSDRWLSYIGSRESEERDIVSWRNKLRGDPSQEVETKCQSTDEAPR